MGTHREVEVTYAPEAAAEVPDLTGLGGVAQVRAQPPVELRAVYYDTDDLGLLRSGVSLRRRTGGGDEGWHLKVPADGARDEIQEPLGSSTAEPPRSMRDLVLGWTRGAPLTPVATVTTHRSPTQLIGQGGDVLAEFTDDRVEGAPSGGATVRWREWELELVDGTPDLLEEADRMLSASGIGHAEVSRKVARVLGDRLTPPLPPPKAGDAVSGLVRARLADQVEALALSDVGARRGGDEGVHKMRVACRRLRAVLATSRLVLDREQTDPVRDELHWLSGMLEQARDSVVVHEQLSELVDGEPRDLVHGPVRRRLRSTYRGRGKDEVREALASPRYFALRDRLDQLVADLPCTELAGAPARKVAPRLLGKELKRYRKRARAAADAQDGAEDPTAALHEARKAAKRLRYAAETVEPIAGKRARRLARDAHHVSSHLGELQDTAVARTELLALTKAAASAGEPTFTYGRLHAREEARADQLTSAYSAEDTLETLKARTRKASAAIRGK